MATVYNIMLYGGLALAVIFAVTAIILFFALKIPKAIGDVTGSTARKKIEEIREKGYESVQGMGVSKQDAIKNHATKISVRDVQSSESSKRTEKGRANYEKAVAEVKNKKKREDMQELTSDMYSDPEAATDVLREYDDSEAATDVLREEDSEAATDVLMSEDDEEATDVLMSGDDEEATDVLRSEDDEEATDVLRSEDDEEATDVLRSEDDDAATDVLRGDDSDATDVLTSDTDIAEQVEEREHGQLRMIKNVVVVHTDESI